MKVIGITGGSGVGKTTALHCLLERGACILDCDRIYHEMLKTHRPMRDALRARFPDAFGPAGLERQKLGTLVFSDKAALADLNAITHHYIVEELRARLVKARQAGCLIAAIDAAELHTGGAAALCDFTVAVTAPTAKRVARLQRRDGIPEEAARRRIAAQKRDEAYEALCDYTLENDCDTAEEFAGVCRTFFDRILQEYTIKET